MSMRTDSGVISSFIGMCAIWLRACIAPVSSGERVGIWALNRWEWTMVQYATAELGAIMVNINPAYRQHELNYVLEQAGITTIIASEEVPTANYPQMIQRAQ